VFCLQDLLLPVLFIACVYEQQMHQGLNVLFSFVLSSFPITHRSPLFSNIALVLEWLVFSRVCHPQLFPAPYIDFFFLFCDFLDSCIPKPPLKQRIRPRYQFPFSFGNRAPSWPEFFLLLTPISGRIHRTPFTLVPIHLL